MGYISEYTTVGKLKIIPNDLQMYGWPCSSMLKLALSSWMNIRICKYLGYQPEQKRVVPPTMSNFDINSK